MRPSVVIGRGSFALGDWLRRESGLVRILLLYPCGYQTERSHVGSVVDVLIVVAVFGYLAWFLKRGGGGG